MPSKRLRSKDNLGRMVTDNRSRTAKTEVYAAPTTIANGEVTSDQLAYRAVDAASLNTQAVTSQKFAPNAWTPNGEGIQRVPAPLTDGAYWTDVIQGDIELHKEGVHAEEDIQHCEATNTGVLMKSTSTAESRLFLTGRFRRPDSSALFINGESESDTVASTVLSVAPASGGTEITLTSDHHVQPGDSVVVTGSSRAITVVDEAGLLQMFYVFASGIVYVETHQASGLFTGDTIQVYTTGYLASYMPTGTYTVNYALPYSSGVYISTPGSPATYDFWAAGNATMVKTDVMDGVYTVASTSSANALTIATARYLLDFSDGAVFASTSGWVAATPGSIPAQSVRVVWWATYDLSTNHRYLYPTMGRQLELQAPRYDLDHIWVQAAGGGAYSTVTVQTTTTHDMQVGEIVNIGSTSKTAIAAEYGGQFTITGVSSNLISWQIPPIEVTADASLLSGDGASQVWASLEVYDYSVYMELPAGFPQTLLKRLDVFEVVGHTTANGGSARIAPNGIQLIGSGEPGAQSIAVSLTTEGNTILRVQSTDNNGNTTDTAAIYSDGTGAFELLKADLDFNLSGTDLGREYDSSGTEVPVRSFYNATRNATAYSGSWLNRLARGVIYCGSWNVPGTLAIPAGTAGTPLAYVLATGSFVLEDQRSYRIMANLAGLRQATAPANPTYYTLRFSLTQPAVNAYPTRYSMSSYMPASSTNTIPDMSGQFQADASVTDVNGKAILGTITGVTASGGVVTYTVGAGHGFKPGMRITVTGVTPTAYNLTNVTVLSVTSTQVRVTNAATGTYVSGGTMTAYDARYLPANTRIYWAMMIHATLATATYNLAGTNLTDGQSNLNVTVEDVGQAIQSEASYVGALTSVAPGATVLTATKTITATESGYWDNYGRGSYGTSDPYANQYSLYQGNPGTSSGTKKSAIEFPSLGLPATTTAITGMRLYLKNRHTYDGSLSAHVGAFGNGDTTSGNYELGSSLPSPRTACGIVSRTYSSGEGAWITLPSSWYSEWLSGAADGVLLGITSTSGTYDSTISNYGYFDGVGTGMTAPPKLEITYTYTV